MSINRPEGPAYVSRSKKYAESVYCTFHQSKARTVLYRSSSLADSADPYVYQKLKEVKSRAQIQWMWLFDGV